MTNQQPEAFWYPITPALNMSKEQIGGKAHGLQEMLKAGIAVPPAIVIPTSWCVQYMENPAPVVARLDAELSSIYDYMRTVSPKTLPPIMSVRSGARVSMPGMMDTILNVGFDGNTHAEWTVSGTIPDDCLLDSRKRGVVMYAGVVHQIDKKEFEGLSFVDTYNAFTELTGHEFPSALEQLRNSILAVFSSWNNERAVYYRDLNKIPHTWGTACVVQTMVFGNFNDQSCTGVLFTRDPATGAHVVKGEFAVNAQGEDVVAGIVTPVNVEGMKDWNTGAYVQLMALCNKLEAYFGDVQDIEFTVQNGHLYLLQTRNAKRTPQAAVRIALEMSTQPEKLKRMLSFEQYQKAQVNSLAPTFKDAPWATGIPACPGVVTGRPVWSNDDAINCKEPCVLVTDETTPEDLKGMHKSVGILTMTGGHTSHAAVVARGMNRACVVGLGKEWLPKLKAMAPNKISICGATGRVWLDEVPVVGGNNKDLDALRLRVRAYNKDVKVWGDDYTDVTEVLLRGLPSVFSSKCVKGRPLTDAEKSFMLVYAKPGVTKSPASMKEITGVPGDLKVDGQPVMTMEQLMKNALG